MIAIKIAITENKALINVIDNKPNDFEISIPPIDEPNAIPTLNAEIFKTEETSVVSRKYFSESCITYNCIPGTVAKPMNPIIAIKISAGILYGNKTNIKPKVANSIANKTISVLIGFLLENLPPKRFPNATAIPYSSNIKVI